MNHSRLADEKADLRKRCYDRRIRILGEEAEAAALAVAKGLNDALDITGGTIVSAYWPLPGEFDPRPALLKLGERGAAPALPRTVGDGKPLVFHAWQPGDRLIEGRFKVMEPAADSPIVTPTILLVPLLAFDRRCNRLGHGKGYYDRTLERLKVNEPAALAVGVAFAAQEVEHVPTDNFDQTLDMVVTETAVHRST
ncbi:MAG: 5-formyltetrahydrofolate cyclo-ligase [Pseudomonadota bacterium]